MKERKKLKYKTLLIQRFILFGLKKCYEQNEKPILVQLPCYLIDIMKRYVKKRELKCANIKVVPTFLNSDVMFIKCKSGKTLGVPTAIDDALVGAV